MFDATGLSQRHACRLTGLSLSTCRYEAQRPAADANLSGRITELALERRRFGYRRIWQLLRREGLHVNHKRVCPEMEGQDQPKRKTLECYHTKRQLEVVTNNPTTD